MDNRIRYTPMYKVRIKIGSIAYYAIKGLKPIPWVSWYPESPKHVPDLFSQDDAAAIMRHYSDQKPETEKVMLQDDPT